MSKEKRLVNSTPTQPHKKVSTLPNSSGIDKKNVSTSIPHSPLASLKERAVKKDPQEVFQMLEIIGKGLRFLCTNFSIRNIRLISYDLFLFMKVLWDCVHLQTHQKKQNICCKVD
jgi:hypothetical protein